MLIVGLGNPGKEYENSRHNTGFMAIDKFASAHDEFTPWVNKKDLKCSVTSGSIGSVRVILAKPLTYMNESGQAIQAIQNFYKLANTQTIVIHDELDIPFGQIRTRIGGSDAGHNGIKSLIAHCGDNFGRIRVGILNVHKPGSETSEFVLKDFNSDEKKNLPSMAKEVENILVESIYAGQLNTETRSFIV